MTTRVKPVNLGRMKIANIYVPHLVIGAALLGVIIVSLTRAGVMAWLPLWAASALCGASLMAVSFLVHYILRARRLARVVWNNLPGLEPASDGFSQDISAIPNPTPDPLQLPRESTLFYTMGGGAFFGLLFTLPWLRWVGVVVAIVGAVVYATYDYLPRFDRDAREERANRKRAGGKSAADKKQNSR